jgi:hypothetical protein
MSEYENENDLNALGPRGGEELLSGADDYAVDDDNNLDNDHMERDFKAVEYEDAKMSGFEPGQEDYNDHYDSAHNVTNSFSNNEDMPLDDDMGHHHWDSADNSKEWNSERGGEEQPNANVNVADNSKEWNSEGGGEEQPSANVNVSTSAPSNDDTILRGWKTEFKSATRASVQDATQKIEETLKDMKDHSQRIVEQLSEFLSGTDAVKIDYSRSRQSQVEESMRLAEMGPQVGTACDHLLAGAAASAKMSALRNSRA